jgi:hypothetical protein
MRSSVHVRSLRSGPARTAVLIAAIGALAVLPSSAAANAVPVDVTPGASVPHSVPATSAPAPVPAPGPAPSPAPTPVPVPAAPTPTAPQPTLVCSGSTCYNPEVRNAIGESVWDQMWDPGNPEYSPVQEGLDWGEVGEAGATRPAPLTSWCTSVDGGSPSCGGVMDDPSDTGDAGGSDPDGDLTN